MTPGVKKYGLLGAALGFVMNFAIYFIDYTWFVSFSLLGVILLLTAVFMFLAAKTDRDLNGGVITFGGAFKSAFLTSVILAIGSLVSSIILFQFIDPDLGMKITDAALEKAVGMMERFGAPADAIDQAVADMDGQEENYTLVGQLKQTAKGLIFYAIMAAIVAAIVKRSEAKH
jgi:hypothetical protein